MPTSLLGRSLLVLAVLIIPTAPARGALQGPPKTAGERAKPPAPAASPAVAAAAAPAEPQRRTQPVIERIVLLDCSTSMLSGTDPDAPLNRWEEASRDIRTQVRTWQEEHADWPVTVVPFELEAYPAQVKDEEHLVAIIGDHRPANRGGRAHLYKALAAVLQRLARREADLYQIWVYSDGSHTAYAQEGGPSASELAASFCENLRLAEPSSLVLDWVWPFQKGGTDLASFLARVRQCLPDERIWSVRSDRVPAVIFLPPAPVLFALPEDHPSKVESRPVRWRVWVDPRLRDTELGFLWETSEVGETRADFGFVPNDFVLPAGGVDLATLEGHFELGNFWDMKLEKPYRFTASASIVQAPRELAIRYIGTNPVEGTVELLPRASLDVLGPEDRTEAPIDVGKPEVHVPIRLQWNSGARGGQLTWSSPLQETLDVSLWTLPKEGPPQPWKPPAELTGAGEVALNLVLKRKKPEPKEAAPESTPGEESAGEPGKPSKKSASEPAADEKTLAEPDEPPLLFEESAPVLFSLRGLEEPIDRALTLVVDPPPRITVELDQEVAPEGVLSRFFFGQVVELPGVLRIQPSNRRARGLPVEVQVEKPDGIPFFEILDVDGHNVLRRGLRLSDEVGTPTLLNLRFETSRLPDDGGEVTISFRCGKEPELLWSDEIRLRLIPSGPRVWVPTPLATRSRLPYRELRDPIRTPVVLKWNRAAEGKEVTVSMRPTPGLKTVMKLGDDEVGERIVLGEEHEALLTLEMTPEQYGEHRLELGLEGFGHRRDLEFVLDRPNAQFIAKYTPPSLEEPPLLKVGQPHSYAQVQLKPANAQSASARLVFDRNLRKDLEVRFRVDGEILDPPVVNFSAEKPEVLVDIEIEATFDYWKRFGFPDHSEPEPMAPPRANSISIRPRSAADSVNNRPEIVIPIVFRLARPGIELLLDGELPEELDLGRVELPGTGYWGWLVGGGTRQVTGPAMLLKGQNITRGLSASLKGPLLTVTAGPKEIFPSAQLVSVKREGGSFVQVQLELAESIEPNLLTAKHVEGHLRFAGPEGLDTPDDVVNVRVEIAPTLTILQLALLVLVLGGLITFGIRKLRSRSVRTTDDILWSHLEPPRQTEPRSGGTPSNPNRPLSDG